MRRNRWLPAMLVLALLVTASAICNGGSGNYTGDGQPREMRWALGEGELTSHALDRWADAFPTCSIVKYAAAVNNNQVTEYLVVWYTCAADQ